MVRGKEVIPGLVLEKHRLCVSLSQLGKSSLLGWNLLKYMHIQQESLALEGRASVKVAMKKDWFEDDARKLVN